jgi:hypothetical protein
VRHQVLLEAREAEFKQLSESETKDDKSQCIKPQETMQPTTKPADDEAQNDSIFGLYSL